MSSESPKVLLTSSFQISDFEREPGYAFLEALKLFGQLEAFQRALSEDISKAKVVTEEINLGLASIIAMTRDVCIKYIDDARDAVRVSREEFERESAIRDRQIQELLKLSSKQQKQIELLLAENNKKKKTFW